MSDTPGGAPGRSPRPDLEPTINEAGASGFVVDGTDSFAVPGPTDTPSTAEDGVPSRSVDRTRLMVTMAAVAAGLLFVVAIGRGGSGAAEDAQLRTGQDGGPEYTLPFWDDDDSTDEIVGVPPGPIDDETLRLLEESGQLDVERRFFDEDELLIEDELDTVTMPTYDVGELDDLDIDDYDYDDDDLDDEGLPTYRPLNTTPRRATTSPRRIPVATTPRVTTPRVVPDDEPVTTPPTTPPPTTPTTPPTTTTTTTTTTPTTLPPAPVPPGPWQDATSDVLPDCPATLRLWADGERLIAAANGQLYALANGTWSSLTGPGGGVQTFVSGPDTSTFWVVTDDGVYATTDAGVSFSPRGVLAGVRSLGVAPNGTSLLAVAGAGLVRWDDVAATWGDPVTVEPADATLGEVSFLDDQHAVVGTNRGIYTSTDGGSWSRVHAEPVIGAPVREGSDVYWLLANGAGVIRSTDLGQHWSNIAPTGVDPSARVLAVSGGRVITSSSAGAGQLVAFTVAGDGSTWSAAPFGPPAPYRPETLVHVGAATHASIANCPLNAAAVLRLADP